jgi:(p)ppGpp synthase/HD superfamily hydrolase
MDVKGARRLLIRAHHQHVDALGKPFISHPLRLGDVSLQHDDRLVDAGTLHDAVEKAGLTSARFETSQPTMSC